jgi:hypothetical protein
MMRSILASLLLLAGGILAAPSAPQWRFDLKQELSGIVALEAIVVNPTLVVMFDRASDDPLQINNHSAWGALWDLSTSTVKPLDVLTNSFCASGALLSNGTMVSELTMVTGQYQINVLQVSLGGDPRGFTGNPAIHPGNMAIRIFEPCASPDGTGCTLFEDPATVHLAADRWYPSSIRIFDGSLMIVGGVSSRYLTYRANKR